MQTFARLIFKFSPRVADRCRHVIRTTFFASIFSVLQLAAGDDTSLAAVRGNCLFEPSPCEHKDEIVLQSLGTQAKWPMDHFLLAAGGRTMEVEPSPGLRSASMKVAKFFGQSGVGLPASAADTFDGSVVGAAVSATMPTSSNTGYRNAPGYPGSLTNFTGSLQSGQTYRFMNFPRGLSIAESIRDVTFYGCRFASNALVDANVSVYGKNITFDYSSFEPSAASAPPVAYSNGYQYGIDKRRSGRMTIDHSDFWGWGNGIQFGSSSQSEPLIVRNSYFHHARQDGGIDHTDAILENYGGQSYMVFDNNTIVSVGNTNGLALQGNSYHHVTITNNYFSGFGYTVNMCGTFSSCSNIVFTDNTFGTDIKPVWGPLYGWSNNTNNLWRRNKWHVVPGSYYTNVADDNKFWWPNGTLSAADYNGGNSSTDTTPPTVALTAPADGVTVSGTTTVSANASDSVGVVGVQFRIDGTSVGAEDTASPYSINLNTASFSNGSHILSAVARDAAGNSRTAANVSITVSNGPSADIELPVVAVTSPANNSAAVTGESLSIAASASDNVGVVKVEFYLDGGLRCTDTASPHACATTAPTVVGNAQLQARAYDAAGNVGVSTISISVQAPASAPAWQNVAFAAQGGVFTAQFDAVPLQSSQDTVVGLSRVAAAAYTDLAAIVRFGANGRVDVRNGPGYAAQAVVDNVGGARYRIRMVVNVSTKRYSVYITPPGQGEISLALNYAFRDSQSTVATLGNRAKYNERGDVAVSNFSISSSAPVDSIPPSVAVTSPTAGGPVVGTITVSANASDNVGVVGVQFLVDGALLGSEDPSSPYSATLDSLALANGSHSILARARDAAGNLTTSAPISITVNNSTGVPAYCATGGPMLWTNLEACRWPGPGNTGYPAGLALTPSSGRTITVDNTVIDAQKIAGRLVIAARNVTVKNCWITSNGGPTNASGVIFIRPGASATIERCLLDGANATHAAIWHSGTSLIARGNHIRGVNDGIFVWDADNFTIEGNYLHAFTENAGNGHVDGFQTEGASHGVIRHNTFDISQGQTSAIAIWNSRRDSSDIAIDNNLLAGGGFTIYAEDYSPSEANPAGGFSVTNIRITNNRFSRIHYSCVGRWGVWYVRGQPTDGWRRSGNVVLESGQNIDARNPFVGGVECR